MVRPHVSPNRERERDSSVGRSYGSVPASEDYSARLPPRSHKEKPRTQVCMRVCKHEPAWCVYVHVPVLVCLHVCARASLCMCVLVHAYVDVCDYACISVRVCMCVLACLCAHLVLNGMLCCQGLLQCLGV